MRTRIGRHALLILTGVLAVTHGNNANADNVTVFLFSGHIPLDGGMYPDPAVINVGDTVTFWCWDDCHQECIWDEVSGDIPGVSPFSGRTPPGSASAPFGPATAAGSLAYDAHDPFAWCAFPGNASIIANPASFDPQPYVVYGVSPEDMDPDPMVDLDDQFGTKQDVSVTHRGRFMNPVQKQHWPSGPMEVITDEALHYRWFGLNTSDPEPRTVLVTDQFGAEVPWQIDKEPTRLLAPSSKVIGTGDPGAPPPGQHYSCYSVQATESDPDATVLLNDQFGDHGPLEVGGANYLCAPAAKTHEGVTHPLIPASDGRDHLACYSIPVESHDETIRTNNQFTDGFYDQIVAVDDNFLCVPAIKTHPSGVPSLQSRGVVASALLMLLTAFWAARQRLKYGGPA